jgi:ferredoxin
LPYVVIDYSKCNGNGACANHCPTSVFDFSRDGQWCKPRDEYVENERALREFYDKVVLGSRPRSFAIRFHVPDCFLCWQCIGACPSKAIGIEYDDLENREDLIPSGTATQEP